ncbi:MAG: twin-arginine translocation signal domain-containing protein [Thermoguttaceae bacterium]|nr:twin-arginine translocation signal domain-containing protein [Thermoguttaceae bacterium]MDW8077791.1 twin-arginine translocation signal domain-containing protein [Thermoguttaceae bacterium]
MLRTSLRAIPFRCHCCLSRRRFLAACGTACAAGLASSALPKAFGESGAQERRLKIRVMYSLHAPVQDRPDWPNIGFDFRPVMQKIETALREAYPDMEFFPAMASGPEQAKKIVDEDNTAGIDGYIVWQMNCWNRVVQTVAETGKPCLYVDFLFAGSGGFLVYTAGFMRQGQENVGAMCSSKMEDFLAAVGCFRKLREGASAAQVAAAMNRLRVERTPAPGDLTCKADSCTVLSPDETLRRVRDAKILAVGGGWPGIVEALDKELGLKVVRVEFQELNQAYDQADKDQAREIASNWQKSAARVADVTFETLVDSARMYLAEKALLKRHGANAITINCLGGFYGGHIQAYPCMGFHELNNSGLIGGCECDIRSAATMVVFTAMTEGRPGFISDPVIDIATRQIIYAHCVAANRVFGPNGPANPFEILTHSEDRKGAAVRSLMPEGYMTTTLEIAPERKEILFHQAKSVGNSLEDRACRTKLCAEPVGDLEKLMREWDRWGWHRVTFYGDLKEGVFALADRLGWKVTVEA